MHFCLHVYGGWAFIQYVIYLEKIAHSAATTKKRLCPEIFINHFKVVVPAKFHLLVTQKFESLGQYTSI